MTNSQLSDKLKWFADLSELHQQNSFKIRSYTSAAFRIDKYPTQLSTMAIADIEKIDGIGKSMVAKIEQLLATGSFDELNELENKTPQGVQQMFAIKGIGPKKIAYIWNELGIENTGELLYACNENRLAQAKGFGVKTQESIKKSIEFNLANANKFHFAKIEQLANDAFDVLNTFDYTTQLSLTGAIRRNCEIIESLEYCISVVCDTDILIEFLKEKFSINTVLFENNTIQFKLHNTIPIILYLSSEDDFITQLFHTTAAPNHLVKIKNNHTSIPTKIYTSEEEIYNEIGLQYIEPEMREGYNEIELAKTNKLPKLITYGDLKGTLHNHSTYSDGLNTLEEMAVYAKQCGFQYLGICDHSKAAQYAGGLNEAAIEKQHQEINSLNKKLEGFKIFKGIECDILGDGSLDYNEDTWKTFDFIVASIHSNLKMTEEKAMSRLLKAIENPYTTILGHPTGRLLLMREGYPIDAKKMIDACAANGVVIEINAHPYRLDLDWRYIDYALNKSVMLSINPDAHHTEGYHDMYYGVCVARKGGLSSSMCLNAFTVSEIENYFTKRKPK